MSTTVDRLAKLPKWAQQEITRLTYRVEELEGIVTETPKSRLWVRQGISDRIYLPDLYGSTEVAIGNPDSQATLAVRYKFDDPYAVEVSGSWGGIIVKPQAGNLVRIEQDPR